LRPVGEIPNHLINNSRSQNGPGLGLNQSPNIQQRNIFSSLQDLKTPGDDNTASSLRPVGEIPNHLINNSRPQNGLSLGLNQSPNTQQRNIFSSVQDLKTPGDDNTASSLRPVGEIPNYLINNSRSQNGLGLGLNQSPNTQQLQNMSQNEEQRDNLVPKPHNHTKITCDKTLFEKGNGWRNAYPCLAIQVKNHAEFGSLIDVPSHSQRRILVGQVIKTFHVIFPECKLRDLEVAWESCRVILEKDDKDKKDDNDDKDEEEVFGIPILLSLGNSVRKDKAPFRFKVAYQDFKMCVYFLEFGTKPPSEFTFKFPTNTIEYEYDPNEYLIIEKAPKKSSVRGVKEEGNEHKTEPKDRVDCMVENKIEADTSMDIVQINMPNPSYSALKKEKMELEELVMKADERGLYLQQNYYDLEDECAELKEELEQAKQDRIDILPVLPQRPVGNTQNRKPLGDITGSIARRAGG